MNALDWLLDADPAIRWQAMRDLTDAPADQVAAERTRVATEGWGARLLALRREDGLWDAGTPEPEWISLLALLLLRDMGLDASSEEARKAIGLVRNNATWHSRGPWHGTPLFAGEVEPCINGRVVTVGSYFAQDVTGIVERLLGEQMADGGWNCEQENGSTRGSFHTTINVLEGLLEHERATGRSAEVTAATALILVIVTLLPPTATTADPSLARPDAFGISGGFIEVIHGGVRPMPPATALVFSGSTTLGSPPIFTASWPPQRIILLADVPLAVKVLSIAYMNGSTLIGLFEGIVDVQSFAVVRNPPWVTQPACTTASSDEEGLFGADLDGFGKALNPLALSPRALSRPVPHPLPDAVTLDALPPVGMQGTLSTLGSPGSCISWSFGHGLGSYTSSRHPDGAIRWNLQHPGNQISPTFLYALIHSEEGSCAPPARARAISPSSSRSVRPACGRSHTRPIAATSTPSTWVGSSRVKAGSGSAATRRSRCPAPTPISPQPFN